MRRKFQSIFMTIVLAFGLSIVTASSASAAAPVGSQLKHYDFTWSGYDYDYSGSIPVSNPTTVGQHQDLYMRRKVLCPWCSWQPYAPIHNTYY